MVGSPSEVIGNYHNGINDPPKNSFGTHTSPLKEETLLLASPPPTRSGTGEISATRIDLIDRAGNHTAVAYSGSPLIIRIWYKLSDSLRDATIRIRISNENGETILETSSPEDLFKDSSVLIPGGYVDLSIDDLNIPPRKYLLSTFFESQDGLHCYDFWDRVNSIQVVPALPPTQSHPTDSGISWGHPVKACY
jgi:hypothetical protein